MHVTLNKVTHDKKAKTLSVIFSIKGERFTFEIKDAKYSHVMSTLMYNGQDAFYVVVTYMVRDYAATLVSNMVENSIHEHNVRDAFKKWTSLTL